MGTKTKKAAESPVEWAAGRTAELTARLEAVIEASGYRYKAISTRAGMRETWVSDLIQGWHGTRRGKVPAIDTLLLLARGLGCTLAELLGPELLGQPPREQGIGLGGPAPGDVVRHG